MSADLNYILRAKKFKAKKSLGQNFLVDSNVINFIAQNANKDDEILEIGPGLGFVTEQLIQNAKKVVAVEVDKNAIEILNKNLGRHNNFHLFEKDILKTDINSLPFSDSKIKVIANIPYYITSPILVHLLGEIDDTENENRKRIKEIFLMVQLEVAKRIVANKNSQNKEYGMLSILSQMYCDVSIIKTVSKNSFLPSPKVESAIVHFTVKDKPKVKIVRLLRKTLKSIFSTRRKNIKNSLKIANFKGIDESLIKAGINPGTRGEKLSIEEIQKIALELEEFN